MEAIWVTVLLSIVITFTLSVLLGTDYLNKRILAQTANHLVVQGESLVLHLTSWIIVLGLLMLLFALIYYFAPDLTNKSWHWLTPGAAFGIFGWFAASLGFRAYLHYFPSYSATYGSLGAVIVLLTWFYVTGLVLLAGAEINSEIQAAVVEKRLKEQGAALPVAASEPNPSAPATPA